MDSSGTAGAQEFTVFQQDAQTAVLNSTFKRAFRSVYGTLFAHMRSRDWLQELELYALIADEPAICLPELVANKDCIPDAFTHAAVRVLAKLFKDLDPSVRVYQTSTPPLPDLLPVIDRFSQGSGALRPSFNSSTARSFVAACRGSERPFVLTTYDNGVPILDMPTLRVRLFPWLIWATNWSGALTPGCGLAGSLSWYEDTCPDHAGCNPWLKPNGGGRKPGTGFGPSRSLQAAGWGQLLYPPRPDHPEDGPGPVPSIRWEMLRVGLQDAEYLYRLDALLVGCKARCAQNGTCCRMAERAQTTLERVQSVIWDFPWGHWSMSAIEYQHPTHTQNASLVYDVKENVAELIEDMLSNLRMKTDDEYSSGLLSAAPFPTGWGV